MSMVFPEILDPTSIPTGDMPGDKVHITPTHVAKAAAIFPRLWDLLEPVLAASPHHRAVVAVHGGSGVGKSEIGSLLAHALRSNGVGAYVLSGDNYPRRIPSENDAERRRRFTTAGTAVVADEHAAGLAALQAADTDADPAQIAEHPWLAGYQRAGREALEAYLGTSEEVDFDRVNGVLAAFHAGEPTLHLKRMGRVAGDEWTDAVDVRDVSVLVIEWTHGNNPNVRGVDIPILLNSTPEETLAHRRARARDGAVDSPFVTLVLGIEQARLRAGASRAKIIVAKDGSLLDYPAYVASMGENTIDAGPMLNAYPDSIGGNLAGLVDFLAQPPVAGVFSDAYLLPSIFNSDLDRGFSVIDYALNDLYATPADLAALAEAGVRFKFDFILNHASVLSPQFQDIVANGESSAYADFFIDWNKFWAGCGEMTDEGYIQPREDLIKDMFFRKPGLPILMVRLPDGTEKPYWNTFYQEVRYPRPDAQDLMATGLQYSSADALAGRVNAALDAGTKPKDIDYTGFQAARDAVIEWLESRRRYLGQMDLNIKSPLVWDFYAGVLDTLAGYGARIVRLDAFAYAPKEPGAQNFLNDPGTWVLLEQVRQLAAARGLQLLPEIHSRYEEKIHEVINDKGFLTYDFFLPGLLIDAFERADSSTLKRWIGDLLAKGIRAVNMLGCHDGIPLLDLKGLLDDEQIDALIATVKGRGGYVKDLHGEKKMYYQVNATYFSALGESDERLLAARAIQLFMPGKPQVWYLDLVAGRNDHAAVERAGSGGHKEINRTNLTAAAAAEALTKPVVAKQLELLRFRRECPAFGFDAACEVLDLPADQLGLAWTARGHRAELRADLDSAAVSIVATGPDGAETFRFES